MEEYISQLYKKYINSLYGFGIANGIPHDTCLDIIHDVFCNLIVKNIVFETNSMKHYLFRCFINRYVDIQRSRKNTIPIDTNDDLLFEREQTDSEEEDLIEKEETESSKKQQVESLLSQLPLQQRKAVYLRYIEELEYEEIANQLNIKVESARMMVFRGIEKLRKHAGLATRK